MALEQSLGSTMSLGAGTVNPGAAVENVLWPLILEGPKAQARRSLQTRSRIEHCISMESSVVTKKPGELFPQGPADETDENKGDDKSRQPVGEPRVSEADSRVCCLVSLKAGSQGAPDTFSFSFTSCEQSSSCTCAAESRRGNHLS